MVRGEIQVQPWTEESEPTETNIRKTLNEQGLRPYRWSNGPGDVYNAHSHDYHKVIHVVRGSITFGLPERGEEVELRVGDRLDLPAGIVHNALVGSQGVVCLEAHQ